MNTQTTFSDILNRARADGLPVEDRGPTDGMEAQWRSAVAALGDLLRSQLERPTSDNIGGLVLSGPTPVLDCDLAPHFAAWTLVPDSAARARHPLVLPGSGGATPLQASGTLPLTAGDPLGGERFCLVLTPAWSLMMACGTDATGEATFQFSFDPEVVAVACQCARDRLYTVATSRVRVLDTLLDRFVPVDPHYKTVMAFGQGTLKYLSASLTQRATPKRDRPASGSEARDNSHGERSTRLSDVELLRAMFHEIRTPLATIATLTKLLLKQKNLPPKAIEWIEMIQRECQEQIDRFGLISRAVELETCDGAPVRLAPTCLVEAIENCIPRWQKQADRRNLKLEVSFPQKMPQVVSDPAWLDKVLTNTIDNFTSNLPLGSCVSVQIEPAGDRLKVQFTSRSPASVARSERPQLKSLGQLLSFQPETGNLSLNLSATKNLFQSLGGKFIVRNRPQQGEVLTVFLPVE